MSTTQTQPAAVKILLADWIYKLNNNMIESYHFWQTLVAGTYIEACEKGNSARILYLITDVTLAGTLPNQVAKYSTTGNTAAVTNGISFTPPATAGTYRFSAYFIATTATTYSIDFQTTYKNASGTAKTEKIPGIVAGTSTIVSPFTNVTGGANTIVGTWTFQIDNSATAITLSTVGTFTAVTYNLAGVLEQLV